MSTIQITLPRRFDLAQAVCSYGYFLLAPNRWDPVTGVFQRPLNVGRRVVMVTVWQPRGRRTLHVACAPTPDPDERREIRRQVLRMLRLDEPPEVFTEFGRLCPAARRAGFGRLFRSPTLFEDMVKTITGCNVTWPNTMRMNELLCVHLGAGAFPTPAQLAAVSPATLKRRCKVGYRAERIVRLARAVHTGELDLRWFEDRRRTTDEIYDALKAIHGIGPYAASNLCVLLGRYDRLAIDSETYRHFRQVHGVKTPRSSAGLRRLHRRIERHYARYAPCQFLAYWFELWGAYEEHAGGEAASWEARTVGGTFTAAKLR